MKVAHVIATDSPGGRHWRKGPIGEKIAYVPKVREALRRGGKKPELEQSIIRQTGGGGNYL